MTSQNTLPWLAVALALALLALGWTPARADEDKAPFAARWNEAAEAYRAQDYKRAASLYEAMLAETPEGHRPSADLCYNLGNAYYHSGRTGMAVWMYERALAIAPRHGDARQNLALARASLATPPPRPEPFFLFKPLALLLRYLTAGEWAALFAALFVGSTLAATVWILLGARSPLGRLARILTFVGCGSALLTGAFLGPRYYETERERCGVVVQDGATVRAGPGEDEEEYFQSAEGERLLVDEASVRNWLKVTRPSDGRTGYLPEEALRLI